VPRDIQRSQFGDPGLTDAEALSACGPAAAAAFARVNGRNPTLREAVDLAKSVGWTEAGGMNGIANQQALLGKMGIQADVTPAPDWARVRADVGRGAPVIISTPRHYFTVSDVDEAGRYYVGASGTDLVGGSAWLTADQIARQGGGVNGALHLRDAGGSRTGPTAPAMPEGRVPTTVDLAKGSTAGRQVNHQEGLQRVYRDALKAGLGDEGARAAVAIAQTEGGLGGAVGDRDRGTGSAGAFQLFVGPPGFTGQGNALANAWGVPESEVIRRLSDDPHAANEYALTGYLGQAIKQGMAQGLTGAELATYAQTHGQRSESPERAGQNYRVLFSGPSPFAPASDTRERQQFLEQNAPGESTRIASTTQEARGGTWQPRRPETVADVEQAASGATRGQQTTAGRGSYQQGVDAANEQVPPWLKEMMLGGEISKHVMGLFESTPVPQPQEFRLPGLPELPGWRPAPFRLGGRR
jgi:hypothetical protein